WAVFLRNHDELTLEMVTDEDRDYMYRVYASDPQARINLGIRRRLAPLMGNNRRRIELMNALLFSLPGTPIIYYGDEIGMGDNIYLGDRNGVRTPMQWSPDRNAGFSIANPQRVYFPVNIDPEYHYEALNVEAQQNNPHSLLWWMKHLIALRRQYRAFGRGTLRFLSPENPRVLAFVRQWEDERILVVANLSRFAQAVELDLAEFDGTVPVEMFGRTRFPRIGSAPYFVTLGAHAFYWFLLPPESPASHAARTSGAAPALEFRGAWQELVTGEGQERLEEVLPAYLRSARWFRGKARELSGVSVSHAIPVPLRNREALVTLLEARYLDGDAETYVLPLAFAEGDRVRELAGTSPGAIILALTERGVLYDATSDEEFVNVLADGMARRRSWREDRSELVASRTRSFPGLAPVVAGPLKATVLKGEQSNTSINLGDRFLLKLFRKAEAGINPDLEIGRYLTDHTEFRRMPLLAGGLELRVRGGREPTTLGVLHQFVPSEGDAWNWSLSALSQYFERAVVSSVHPTEADLGPRSLVERARLEPPALVQDMVGPYLAQVRLLGRRTAELHLALAGARENPAFVPEAFTALYRRSLYQSVRSTVRTTYDLLRRRVPTLPEPLREQARALLTLEDTLLRQVRAVLERRLAMLRIRIHGDYHLGQVLFTGKDFVIVDFEGEPSRSLSERRFKRSPLRDVAGMIRSFEYAAAYGLRHGPRRAEDVPMLQPWARLWIRWTSAAFLRGYLDLAGDAAYLPPDPGDFSMMLEFYILDKTVYELRYELNNRPTWVDIPLEALLRRVEAEVARGAVAGAAR
ncbi:MAG TPA: putative maltokinase, partial [Gemmatimonadales bacterium]|nr:putative maltokinase [Gemmatimonadales bacterium]